MNIGNGVDAYNRRKKNKELVLKVSSALKVKPFDITAEMLLSHGYTDVDSIMKGVCTFISDAYGVSLSELQKGDKATLMSRYSIPEDKMDILYRYGDIIGAYTSYAKSMLGENGNYDLLSGVRPIYIPDEDKEKKIKEEMYNNEKERLQELLEGEEDPEKIELYEAQLKVLELKHKEDGR